MIDWKYYLPTLFKKKRVELGEGWIEQYVVFEWKPLFSIIFYHWKTIKQNRFHSHAFPAFAFLLTGEYEEETYKNGKIEKKKVNQIGKPRWLPRNYTHRILTAKPRTWSMIITGPWQKYWWEWFDDTNTWVKYTWGRIVVEKSKQVPKDL